MKIDDRYQILDKIGAGSYATVYRAQDNELGREVAVKQIHEQYLADPRCSIGTGPRRNCSRRCSTRTSSRSSTSSATGAGW